MTLSLNAGIILPSEAEKELSMMQEGSLDQCLRSFYEKGGTLVRLNGQEPFTLKPGDYVYPSCSGANNRSQTLWKLLLPYSDKIHLMPPHATRFGFDSFNVKANWKGTKHTHDDDEFESWAGFPKSEKFGWNVFTEWLEKDTAPVEALLEMREFYNTHYFHPELPDGARRVYITFDKNAHVHLFRLCEANDSLEEVVVVFFPLQDLINNPLEEWNTTARSVKSYEELTKILAPHLDFSYLE